MITASTDDFGAEFYVKPAVTWNAGYGAWKVDYSVNINLIIARIQAEEFSTAALDELNANITKYKPAGGPWYQMRYAKTYTSSSSDCGIERPSAYNSELIGGTGWSRSFFVTPGEKTCLTVWMYGDSVFSPKGHSYGGTGIFPMGVAYFVGPPAPSP